MSTEQIYLEWNATGQIFPGTSLFTPDTGVWFFFNNAVYYWSSGTYLSIGGGYDNLAASCLNAGGGSIFPQVYNTRTSAFPIRCIKEEWRVKNDE
jgi:hypothetical protein